MTARETFDLTSYMVELMRLERDRTATAQAFRLALESSNSADLLAHTEQALGIMRECPYRTDFAETALHTAVHRLRLGEDTTARECVNTALDDWEYNFKTSWTAAEATVRKAERG